VNQSRVDRKRVWRLFRSGPWRRGSRGQAVAYHDL